MPETSISAPHLEGLLHLGAIAFVMTLAYLGLDKVGDGARPKLEKEFEAKLDELRKNTARAAFIKQDGSINTLRKIVGKDERKPLCMIFALAKNIRHDLYSSAELARYFHTAHLFFAFRCYINHWDLRAVGLASVATGAAFFALVYAATFRVPVSDTIALAALLGFGIVVLLVISATIGVVTAERRLEANYAQWQKVFDDWLAEINRKTISTADDEASKPIKQPPTG